MMMSENGTCFDSDDYEFIVKLLETIDFDEGKQVVITHEKGGNYHFWVGKSEE